jgi:ABC-type multidrug transport system ATPase subunit
MLQITCTDIAKRYVKEVLFKDLSYTFSDNNKYVLLGANSTGKSTLLKIIGGAIAPTKGTINYSLPIEKHKLFSYTSPEMHLLDDFTVKELFELHFQFKTPKITLKEQWKLSNLTPFLEKPFSELSSGLKNKIKLALAIFTEAPALLMDEPCTNFDDQNIQWYHEMITTYCTNQLIIVASNQESEYPFCTEHLNLNQYKPTS